MEINLLDSLPQTKRNVDDRAANRTEEDRRIARQFGRKFFDGSRNQGYGGYKYDGRWLSVAKRMIEHYNLDENSTILDIGCAKGFLLHDFRQHIPSISVEGIDVSEYAIENGMPDVKKYMHVRNANDLSSYKDKQFDLVISINSLHNLNIQEFKQALKEVERIGKHAFITMDAWTNDEEKKRMEKWNLTAQTMMHVDDWVKLFGEEGYTGDYYWFIP